MSPAAPRRSLARGLLLPVLLVTLGFALAVPLSADAEGDPTRNIRLPSVDLEVPMTVQASEQANCGPTAAAMLLAAYSGDDGSALERLRDAVGAWSWERYPSRAWHLPWRDPGMTTPAMVQGILEHFGGDVRFERLSHPHLAPESSSLMTLAGALAQGRPVLALVEAPTLWGTRKPGLHWIVVRGFEGGRVVFNDPADGKRWSISVRSFWHAWRLSAWYRAIPGIHGYTAFVGDRPMPNRMVAWLRRAAGG
jgi:hypothetical protein